MTSETDIINRSLTELGQPIITDRADPSNERARTADANFDDVRDSVLRDHQWNCATGRVTLSALATPPVFEWAFGYTLPADCLKISTVNDRWSEFKVEGRTILTNDSTVELVYVKRITDPNLMDVSLRECIAYKLAAVMAIKLTGSESKKSAMEQLYRDRLADAQVHDSQEAPIEQMTAASWVSARYNRAPCWPSGANPVAGLPN